MKKKKFKTIILILGIFAILVVGGIYAYENSSISVLNISKIGIVEIDLKTYTLDNNNKEIEVGNSINLKDSNIISYIPRVTNKKYSGDCYIRLKAILKQNGNERVLNDNDIINLNSNFVYFSDGFLYYKNILKQESVNVFDGIKLNDSEIVSDKISIEVKVDAIQAKNVELDFKDLTGKGPWKDISSEEIKEAKNIKDIN